MFRAHSTPVRACRTKRGVAMTIPTHQAEHGVVGDVLAMRQVDGLCSDRQQPATSAGVAA